MGKRVGCPRFLAAKAVEKNGKDCQGLFRDMDTSRPFKKKGAAYIIRVSGGTWHDECKGYEYREGS